MFVYFDQVLGHDAKAYRFTCLKSEFSCICRIPTREGF